MVGFSPLLIMMGKVLLIKTALNVGKQFKGKGFMLLVHGYEMTIAHQN